MSSAGQFEAKAKRFEEEADEVEGFLAKTRQLVLDFEAQIASLREQAAYWRRMANAESGTQPLSSIQKKGTLGVPKMEAESASRGAKVSIARTKSTWPFRQALHKRNLSLPEWARSQKGITVEAAKSWLKAPSGGGRPIPLVWAERIAKEFVSDETGTTEVPPVDASWPNGIR